MKIEHIETVIKNDIAESCKELPMYKRISNVEIREEEFEKTTTNKIKR
jgi:long-chain acyl-CoA synthetase